MTDHPVKLAFDDLNSCLPLIAEAYELAYSPVSGADWRRGRITGTPQWHPPAPADPSGLERLDDARRDLGKVHEVLGSLCRKYAVTFAERYGYPTATAMEHAVITAKWLVAQLGKVDVEDDDAGRLTGYTVLLLGSLRNCRLSHATVAASRCRRCDSIIGYDTVMRLCAAHRCTHCNRRVRDGRHLKCAKCRRPHEHAECGAWECQPVAVVDRG